MGWEVGQILVGLVVLLLGAEALVRGAAALALRLGISPLAVGLTVVAFGTSAPELLVCVQSALAGRGAMAIGNVVGSNVFNVAVILGIAALIHPIHCQAAVVRREIPIMIGAGFLLLPAVLLFGDPGGQAVGILTRPEGVVLVLLCVIYTWATYRLSRRESAAVQLEFAKDVAPPESAERLGRSRWWVSALFVLLGLALLVVGADQLVTGAAQIARRLGASDLVVGITIVGAGTSLPELATSVIAAVRKEPDIALGNVVGSCIFNVLGILGITALVQPLDVERAVLVRDLPAMLLVAVLLLPVALTGRRVARVEGAGLLLLYLAYVAVLLTVPIA